MQKDIVQYTDEKSTSEFIGDTLQAMLEGITGIVEGGKREGILSIGRIFQSMRGGYLLSAVKQEWDRFREQGKIEDDYQYTEQHRNCLHELLDFLDKDIPDEVRFNAIKNILLVAATEEVGDRESILPHQYIKICRKLSSGAILVLFATYQRMEVMTNQVVPKQENANSWLSDIAGRSGLEHPELVETVEQELIANYLLTKRFHHDVRLTEKDRLTDLGYSLCAFIECYDASE